MLKTDNKKLKALININSENATSEDDKELIEELKKSQLFIPMEVTSETDLKDTNIKGVYHLDEPIKFKPYTLETSEGKLFMPLFTDVEELKKTEIESPAAGIYANAIAEMLKKDVDVIDGIIINPSSKYNVEIPIKGFINLFKENEDIKTIIRLFDESVPLKEDIKVFFSEKEPYMKNSAVDNVCMTVIPQPASFDESNETDEYLNVLLLSKGMKVLYSDIKIEGGRDILIAPGSEFKIIEEKGNTIVWECIKQNFYNKDLNLKHTLKKD